MFFVNVVLFTNGKKGGLPLAPFVSEVLFLFELTIDIKNTFKKKRKRKKTL